MICLWLWIVPFIHHSNKMLEFLQYPQINPETSSVGFLNEMLQTQYFEGGHRSEVYLDSEGYPTWGSGIKIENKKYTKPQGAPENWVPQKFRHKRLSEEDGWELFEKMDFYFFFKLKNVYFIRKNCPFLRSIKKHILLVNSLEK